jgi:hypothetical protein
MDGTPNTPAGEVGKPWTADPPIGQLALQAPEARMVR